MTGISSLLPQRAQRLRVHSVARPPPPFPLPIPCCVRSRCRKRGLERPHVRELSVVTSLTIYKVASSRFFTIQFTLFLFSRIKHKADNFDQAIIWIVIERIRRKIFFFVRTESLLFTPVAFVMIIHLILFTYYILHATTIICMLFERKKQITLKYSLNKVTKRECEKRKIVHQHSRVPSCFINNLCETRDAAFL